MTDSKASGRTRDEIQTATTIENITEADKLVSVTVNVEGVDDEDETYSVAVHAETGGTLGCSCVPSENGKHSPASGSYYCDHMIGVDGTRVINALRGNTDEEATELLQ